MVSRSRRYASPYCPRPIHGQPSTEISRKARSTVSNVSKPVIRNISSTSRETFIIRKSGHCFFSKRSNRKPLLEIYSNFAASTVIFEGVFIEAIIFSCVSGVFSAVNLPHREIFSSSSGAEIIVTIQLPPQSCRLSVKNFIFSGVFKKCVGSI